MTAGAATAEAGSKLVITMGCVYDADEAGAVPVAPVRVLGDQYFWTTGALAALAFSLRGECFVTVCAPSAPLPVSDDVDNTMLG